MSLLIYDAVAEAQCDAATGSINDGASAGRLEIRVGSRPAINGALTGTILASFTLADPAFAASVADGDNAVGTADAVSNVTAAASGTAGYGAVLDSDDVVKWTGTVGLSGSGADFILTTTSIVSGQDVGLNSWVFNQPQHA